MCAIERERTREGETERVRERCGSVDVQFLHWAVTYPLLSPVITS